MITMTAGRANVSVTSGAAVDLLNSGTTGVAIPRAFSWTLTVTTSANITVAVSIAAGPNCGFVTVSGWTTTVTSAAPLVLQVSEYPATQIRVQAIAVSTTATVNCDFLAQSSSVN
jgi:hypothetical protein